jgi:hypothetical protein
MAGHAHARRLPPDRVEVDGKRELFEHWLANSA